MVFQKQSQTAGLVVVHSLDQVAPTVIKPGLSIGEFIILNFIYSS